MTVSYNAFVEIKKFLKKLKDVMEYESSFNFMNCRYVNKSRIDDILCCLEANFPQELKKRKTLKSLQSYRELLKIITHKCIFNGSYYSINYSEALKLISYVTENFKQDFDYLNNLSRDMF